MRIIPAIDIIDGKCVRLSKGDYATQKIYNESPLEVAKEFTHCESEDEKSYTNKLFRKGINKIAQKVGEEAVELVIESKDNNLDLFKNEAADLLYHFLIMLKAKDVSLEEVEEVLKGRSK
jgi:phosphoribosyl-ATP pyrophosphohydrolase